VRAAAFAAVFSGAPSTAWAVATGHDPLAATLAAGSMALPSHRSRLPLIAAAAAVHSALSLGWTIALTGLPRRTVTTGALAGLAIAALDLGVAHTSRSLRFAAIRALPVLPQLADHVAFGALVGGVLGRAPS
jgi:hypothetical protein